MAEETPVDQAVKAQEVPLDKGSPAFRVFFALRWVSVLAVAGSFLGAVILFLVGAVDAFLFALALMIFSYGVYRLFLSSAEERGILQIPQDLSSSDHHLAFRGVPGAGNPLGFGLALLGNRRPSFGGAALGRSPETDAVQPLNRSEKR
jgi:hypothetical protein